MNVKIENTEVFGISAAMRGMRNPHNSWALNDTTEKLIGPRDLHLTKTLNLRGPGHSKHLRMIHVWVDMTLPRAVWVEMDTYKFHNQVSCSTIHSLYKRHLTQEDFIRPIMGALLEWFNSQIDLVRSKRMSVLAFTNTVKYDLPEGYLQRRTLDFNYQELYKIYRERRKHPLSVWAHICLWILKLPQFMEVYDIEQNEFDELSKRVSSDLGH
jgi:hypothetical protein